MSNRGLIIVFGDFNYLETKLHQFMKKAFDIRLNTYEISKYVLITRQILLKGTIEQYATFTYMQYSRYDNRTIPDSEQVHVEQSNLTLHKVIRFVIIILFITVALKLLYNYITEIQSIETFTLENVEDVEQRTDQDEGREETTL